MKIANFLLKTKEFLINRITELLGLTIIFFSTSVLVSLMSYSPDDPNFIINEKENIKNLLGFRGSIIADFLFQSIGLIAYLVPGNNVCLNSTFFCSKSLISSTI